MNEKPAHNDEVMEDDQAGKLNEEEAARTGDVNLSVYKYYAENIGYLVILLVLTLFGIEQGLRAGANIFLRHW